jgi:hypothetical protein
MSAALKEKRKGTNDLDISDLGRPDTLRYNVLTFVINEEYDRAITFLKDFLNKESPYATFRLKTERYVQHSIDLIFAIRTKRNFPGLTSLTRTKQHELKEKFKEHFQELKHVIKKIENCQEELRLSDIKSTQIVVKAVWISIAMVTASALALEILKGLGFTMYVVFDEYLGLALDWIYKFVGLI